MKYGLNKDLWTTYQTVIQMCHEYRMLEGKNYNPLDFEKCLADTLTKWKFITKWTAYLKTKLVIELKTHPSFDKIKNLILEEEPLCFESLFHRKYKDSCRACPIFSLNSKSCAQAGNVKEVITRPIKDGDGVFKPYDMVKLLLQIGRRRPIDKIEGVCYA